MCGSVKRASHIRILGRLRRIPEIVGERQFRPGPGAADAWIWKIIAAPLICMMGMSLSAWGAEPQIPFWSGRLPEKSSPTRSPAASVEKTSASTTDTRKPVDAPSTQGARVREPDWLKRIDRNDRATLSGGWGLQNLSGGALLTTAGERAGQYAPNTYQAAQFHRWNNVAVRQEIPSWNSPTPGFPTEMWSRGPVGPNSYFGPDAQRWGNMSAGAMSPNPVSGGWLWR
jgi:hypothetical protein